MRLRVGLLLMVCVLALAPAAQAQDFGVLESAETINPGTFKIGAYPFFALPDEGDTDFRFAVALGYGFTTRFDLEGRAAFSDDIRFLGGDAEFGLLKNQPLDLSVRGGFHVGLVEGDVATTRSLFHARRESAKYVFLLDRTVFGPGLADQPDQPVRVFACFAASRGLFAHSRSGRFFNLP